MRARSTHKHMAERLRKHHQDDIRKKISVIVIVDRLQKHVKGEIDMTPTQIGAAKILLDKTLSNAPVENTIEALIEHHHTTRPQLTPQQWLDAHGVRALTNTLPEVPQEWTTSRMRSANPTPQKSQDPDKRKEYMQGYLERRRAILAPETVETICFPAEPAE